MCEENADYKAYLFVHFVGEEPDGEQIYFSYSEDALHWKDLNGGRPVLRSDIGEKGVRDPFLIRSPINGKFYIIATDLRIASGKGWDTASHAGSRNIVVWESDDLVMWSKPWQANIGVPGAGCVWAPEAVFDRNSGDFLVFWASMTTDTEKNTAKQKIYCAHTKDFHEFTSTEKYMESRNDVIDTTILENNGAYYRFSKDETTKNIRMEKGTSLDKNSFRPFPVSAVESIRGVEGPEIFRLNDGKGWCLIVDRFAEGKGYLPLLTDDLESADFRVLKDGEFDFGGNKKRHGGVLPITAEESGRLLSAFGDGHQILPGQFADPDICKWNGRYYLYPTTDGFSGWSGTQFHVFTSQDRRVWNDGGIILDLSPANGLWAVGSAWAPTAAYLDGKYYFYFCGKTRAGVSAIGVAVSEVPTGPFHAEPKPLITMELVKELGVSVDQTIDPSIYREDNGAFYLLFGNGSPAIVRLQPNMTGICRETAKNLEGLTDFREAVNVFKRGGIYHFTWSCDDTGSENYHVNYGTADHLYGPVTYRYPVLMKNPSKSILGTGHNSILYDPENEEYWIAYHRFVTPLTRFPDEKGCHREVCLDRITFGEDGLMQPMQL